MHFVSQWFLTVQLGSYLYMADIESRNRFVFCEKCVDFIYDHTLDRLRGPSAKFETLGEI